MTSPLDDLAAIIGDAFGDIFYDAVLTRTIPGNGPAYDPGEPTTQDYPCKALSESFSAYTRGQGLVAATDMKVMILTASLEVTPQPLDAIVIASQGFSGQIVAGSTSGMQGASTDPAKAVWTCRCAT